MYSSVKSDECVLIHIQISCIQTVWEGLETANRDFSKMWECWIVSVYAFYVFCYISFCFNQNIVVVIFLSIECSRNLRARLWKCFMFELHIVNSTALFSYLFLKTEEAFFNKTTENLHPCSFCLVTSQVCRDSGQSLRKQRQVSPETLMCPNTQIWCLSF